MADVTPTATNDPARRAAGEEQLLLDHLRRIDRGRDGLFAVHIHLSGLRARYRQPSHLRVASRFLDQLVRSFDATLYVLQAADMVLLCRDVPIDDIDHAVAKLRGLFSDDPLTYSDEDALTDRFTSWYDLTRPSDYARFLDVVRDLAARAMALPVGRDAPPPPASTPLDIANLTVINRRLQGTRVADLIRRQSAIDIRRGGLDSKILFREHYVSMAGLQQRIAPKIDLKSSPWLFQYLTETLDRRILAVIGRRNFENQRHAVSMNLNISTVLSPGFRTFHERVEGHADRIVVELQAIDVFADMGAFAYVRDWLQDRGYRVLIDGLDPVSLQFFDFDLLEVDFVKINWNADAFDGLGENRKAMLRDVLRRAGPDSVILARTDSEAAVKWGLSMGLRQFQGHFIDGLIRSTREKAMASDTAGSSPAAGFGLDRG